MPSYYELFKNLSDENLFRRLNNKEYHHEDSIMAVFDILIRRGYSLPIPYPHREHVKAESLFPSSFLKERKQHQWFNFLIKPVSNIKLIFTLLLVYLFVIFGNSPYWGLIIPPSVKYNFHFLFTQTTFFFIFLLILFSILEVNTKTKWKQLLNVNNKRVFTAIFVTLITIIIISLLELLFLNKLTIIQIFYHGSIKEFTGLMIQLFFNSFTEEIIIKWFVLSQLLVKLKNRDQKWAIIITSLYFSFLHIPRFVDEGDTSYVLRGCIFTFLFSFITSFIYIKRRNFILIVVFHFLNNLPIEFDLEYHRFFQNTLLLFIFLYIFSWVDKIKLFDFYYSFKIKVNKKVSLIIGTLLLIIIYFLPNTNKDKYNFALGYYENDNNEKSLEYINQIIENDDTFSDAYVLKGRLQQDIYDFDSAIVNYDKAIELDTNNTEALYYRGIVHHNMKNYEAAIQDLKDPIERKYNTVTAYQARGESYFKLNEYQKAIYDFNEAAVLKKGNITAYRGLGKTYVKLEEFDKGIEYFEKALFYGDSSYLNLFYLLDAQMQKNDDVNVEKVFKMIKAREFSIDKYYFVRANMSLYYGDYQEAIGHLKESVKYGYPKGVTYYFISVTYQKLDDIENEKKYLLYSADEGYQEAERILKERFGIRIIE